MRAQERKRIAPFVRSDFGLTDEYGRNTRMIVLRSSYDEQVLNAADPDDLLSHAAVMYQLFPNTVLVWQGPHMEVWTAYPHDGAPDRCILRVSVLIPEPTNADAEVRNWRRNWEILMGTVLNEDFAVSRDAGLQGPMGANLELFDLDGVQSSRAPISLERRAVVWSGFR